MSQMSHSNFEFVIENLKNICYNVNNAVSKYRKTSEIVKIMAVTKTVAPEIVNIAIDNGINLLGENRVQEYISKKDFYNDASVHFIGNLQTNKVKYIVDSVDMIQSVNSIKLANEINKLSKARNITKDILIEVNIGKESTKLGADAIYLEEIISEISAMQNVRIKGLMAIPPIGASEDVYEKMANLYLDIANKKMDNVDMSVLSMGMSNDYETAIKYGANIIRLGTALFGARNYMEGF